MSAQEITSSVENIEIEAEKMLEMAKSRANEILLKAKEEATKILSSELPLDEVKKQHQQIVKEAKDEANKKVKAAKVQAAKMKADTKQVEKIVTRIVSVITGARLE